jgi:zinc protease
MKPSILPTLPLLALLALPAQAADRPKLELQLDEYALQTRDFCFASGLRVSFQEDHSQPMVSVTSVIDRGADADPEGLEGIAHVVEHLWFRSQRGELPPTWDILKEMGATINAFTARDVTTYMTVAPKAMMPAVLELEAQRLLGAVEGVTEEVLTTEREVIRNELRQGEAYGLGFDAIHAALYPPDHPYSDSIIGTRENLDAITLAEVQRFVADNYTPANTTVMVVGDFSLDDAPDMLVKAFPPALVFHPDRPEGPASAEACPIRVDGPSPEPPPPADREVTTIKAPVERQTVLMAWSLPGGYRPDTPLMEMVSYTMSWAVSSYLNAYNTPPWKERNEAFCFLDPGEHASTATCVLELTDDADPQKMIKKAADGLYQMWDPEMRRFQEQYYSRSSLQVMADVFRSADEVASLFSTRGTESALFTHFTGNSAYYSTSFQWLGHIDGQQAAKLANTYLTRDRYVAVVLEPFDDDEDPGLADEGGYTGHPREPAADTVVDLDALDAETIATITVEPDLGQLRDFELDNGLRVVLYPYGEVPIARTALVVRGGELHEPIAGLDRFAWSQTSSAPSDLELPLDEAPLRIGGSWEDWESSDLRVLEVNGSSGNLDAQLWLMLRRLEGMEVDGGGAKAYARELQKQLRGERELPEHWATELANRALLAGHPLGRGPTDEDVLALEGLSDEQSARWIHQQFQPANATLVVVGRFDAEAAEQTVRSLFSGWRAQPGVGQPIQPMKPLPQPAERMIWVLDKPQVSQTEVWLQCQLAPARDGDSEARRLLADVLDEMAWNTLRENAGVTYGSGVFAREYAGGAARLAMVTTAQTDASGFVVDTFLDLVDRGDRGELDPQLLELFALREARGYVLGQQSTNQMLGRLVEPLELARGWDHISDHGARLGTVTVDQLPPLMQGCKDREIITLVGPVEAVSASLDAAGHSYEVYDWEAERDQLWERYDPKGWKAELKRRDKAE